MKTTLVIMAAGIGSRFGGGIKQLAPVGLNGEIIMEFRQTVPNLGEPVRRYLPARMYSMSHLRLSMQMTIMEKKPS